MKLTVTYEEEFNRCCDCPFGKNHIARGSFTANGGTHHSGMYGYDWICTHGDKRVPIQDPYGKIWEGCPATEGESVRI